MRVKDGGYQLDAPFKVDVPKTLKSFYLRMRSNGTSGQAAYSTNGTDWTDVGKARDITDVVSGSTLGPLALRGGAATSVTAKFDYFRLRPSPVAACTANGTVEAGYERLWNGIDLAGTTHAGPGCFNIVNDGAEGCRLVSNGGLGLLWFNTKTYDNFVLRTQFKTADDTDNSGIFVRFPNPGTDPNVAINQGHEIQIREGIAGDGEDQKTGSVYNFKRETARAAKPAGQWNDYEIRYEAGKYTITLNGTVVNTWQNNLQQAKQGGYIGLQNHSTNDEVSFRNVRIQALASAQTNLFTTIGITRSETRANSQIYGNPTPYSLPAEEMPPSGTVGAPPNDGSDDVPMRMPDTSGTKPNLAAFNAQTLTLRAEDQKPYAKLHFFGTTSDGGPAGGDFILKYSDGTSATITQVRFPDWCGSPTAAAHRAIGPLSQRYRTTGSDGAPCSIYHFPANNPQPTKTLVSVQLPATTSPGNAPIQSYLMALTLEDANGLFKMPDLSGSLAFPDDQTAPVSTATVAPTAPDGDDGWFKTAPRITLAAQDTGGSGVEQMIYKVDGGTPQNYTGPFDFTLEGAHTLEFQAIDGAGNAETFKKLDLKVDPNAPTTTPAVTPGEPLGSSGWYDSAITVRLKPGDGAGSGVEATEYKLDGSDAWVPYSTPLTVSAQGEHTLAVPLGGRRRQHRGDQGADAEGRRHRARHHGDAQRRRADHRLPGSRAGCAHARRRRRLGRGQDRVPGRQRRVDGLRRRGCVRRLRRRRPPSGLPLDRRRRQRRELQDAALQRRGAGHPGGARADPGGRRAGAQAEAVRLDRRARPSDGGAAAHRPEHRAHRLPGRGPRDALAEGLQGHGQAPEAQEHHARQWLHPVRGPGARHVDHQAELDRPQGTRQDQELDHRHVRAAFRRRYRYADRDVQGEVVMSRGRNMKRTLRVLLASALLVLSCAATASAQSVKVLVFTGPSDTTTTAGVTAIKAIGTANNFGVDSTAAATDINATKLQDYRSLVFLNTAGDLLNAEQEAAVQQFVEAGNGFLGIGSAAQGETGAFFDGLIGARPATSSSTTPASKLVVPGDRVSPATKALPLQLTRTDVWYQWNARVTGNVHVVARYRTPGAPAGDGTKDPGADNDTPISWCRDYRGGRSFYTGMGRTPESYGEDNFKEHLKGAVMWTAGLSRMNCKATINASYKGTKIVSAGASGQRPRDRAASRTASPWPTTAGSSTSAAATAAPTPSAARCYGGEPVRPHPRPLQPARRHGLRHACTSMTRRSPTARSTAA